MKHLMKFGLILLSAYIVSACGGGSQEKSDKESSDKEENTEESSENGQKNTDTESNNQGINQKREERRKKGDTLALPYKELQAYLPKEIEGFELKGEMKGQIMNAQGMSFSNAEADYEKGEDKLYISLVDYNSAYTIFEGLTAAWAMGISVENDDQKTGVITLKGHKGWENYQKQSKTAELLLGISDRFYLIVRAENQADMSLVKVIAQKIDLEKLGKL